MAGCALSAAPLQMQARHSVPEVGEKTVASVGKQQADGRGKLFEWGNYAMFIHWGLYSNLANVWNGKTYYGIGEWIMSKEMANINADEYKATAKEFNPTDFDAMKIAQLAKDAGMKYIIITSKHHDGFAMYGSKCSPFNIVDATPFGRDPMKELSEACHKLGLGFGFYYSHNQDWTTPGASGAPKVDKDGNKRSFKDYFYSKCLPQVEEITRNYGDMELIWFDTPGEIPQEYSQKLVETVHRNQPKALVSGRVGYGLGDYETLGDMEVPAQNIDGLWESVDVTNDSWGYSWYDRNWKSPQTILQNLVSTVARGGTYMLNVGPDGKGNIPDAVQQSLRAAGRWIARYPYAVYGAEPSPWKHAMPWGDIVKQGDKLYLCVYQWPRGGKLYLPGLHTAIKKASLVSAGKKIRVQCSRLSDGWTVVSLPYKSPDPLVSVVELEMSAANVVADTMQGVDPELGIPSLSVCFAQTEGCSVRKSSWMEKYGEWKHKHCVNGLGDGGKIVWTVNVQQAGTYNVQVEARGNGRMVWRLETDEKQVLQNQQGVASQFMPRPLGWLHFDKPGVHTLTLTMPEGGQCEVSALNLVPVCMGN